MESTMEGSSGVYFSRSYFGTRYDCISIGQGDSQVTMRSISCGPVHGISVGNSSKRNKYSVGSLGKYLNEGNISGLVVSDDTMTDTMNGIRIKTSPNSLGRSAATNMTFQNQNIVMRNVTNPIIIDQSSCPFTYCTSMKPSKAKLRDIKNTGGTSSSEVAVTLECSIGVPCQNMYLEDVRLDFTSGDKHAASMIELFLIAWDPHGVTAFLKYGSSRISSHLRTIRAQLSCIFQ